MKIPSEDISSALPDNEAYYRILVENCPTAFIISRQGKVIYVNKSCLEMFGYDSTADVRGTSMFNHVAPDYREQIIEIVKKRFQGEEVPSKYVTFGIRTDGSIFPFEVDVAMLALPDGPAAVSFINDITAHKNAENILKETEAKWRSITENSPDHIMMLDRNFDILFINYVIPGFEINEVIGTSIKNYLPPFYQKIMTNCLEQVLETGEPGAYEVVYDGSGSEKIYFESRVGAIKSGNEVVALLVNARDVTDRTRAERALEKSEKKYRELVDQAASVILRWDINGKITFFNEYAQNYFGFGDEIIGQDVIGTIVPEVDFAGRDLAKLIDDIRHDPSQFEYNENENVTRSGERVWVAWRNKPVFNEYGELVEILSVGIDSTKRKIAEDKIRESEKTLKAILNSLQDTYYRIDNEGYITRVSSSMEQLLGYSEKEALNIRALDLYYDPAVREKFLQSLAENNGRLSNYQAQLKCKDGSVIWVSTNAHYCFDDQGNVVGIEGTTRDITKLIEYEEALQRSEQRFRAIFERSASGIALVDLQGYPVVTNRAVQEMLGYSEVELSGKTFSEFTHSDDVEKITLLQKGIESGFSDHFKTEVRCFRQDGALVWISLTVSAIRHESGEVDYLVGVLEDISERKKMEVALEQSTAKFKAIFNAISDAVFFIDSNRCVVMINPAVTKLFGYTLNELENQCTNHLYVNQDDFIRLGNDRFNEDASLDQPLIEIPYVRKDGSVFIGESFGTRVQDEQGDFIGFIGIVRDITERKRTDERLRLSQQIFEDAGKAILVINACANIVDMNDAFCKISGYVKDELVGKMPTVLLSPRHDDTFYNNIWNELSLSGYWQGELWERKKNGEEYPNWATISAVKDERGNASNYVAVFSDITAIKETEERLEQLAHYDQLTGLPNRMLFQDRLHSSVARSKRHDHSIAVMYVDLDGFKQVNDTLGHAAGDNLLIEIGSRLNRCVRDEDTIARLGGDEFAIIINELQGMSYLHALAKRVVNELSTTLSYEGRELHVSGSVGIATFPSDKTDEHNLLRNADQAMYHAKQKGKNTYQFFDPDMNTKMINRIHLESDLRYAIKFDELFVHYQPKYDLQKNKVVGVEALVRWLHPERGLVLPLDFIPVAEDSELIIDLGRQVLEKACQDAQAWYNAGRLSIPVAVNISARQFKYDHFVRDVKYALEMSGLSPDLLEIEITESVLMDDVENTITTLNELKSMGMSISIDDFGTGYSSLNYLKKLPVDTLKIDRSFVMDIADDDDDRAIISAIISMAKSLNLRVIAEGVENEQQLDFLSKNFCHEIQGFLLTEPVSCGELNSLIDSIEAKWDRVDALV